MTTKKGALAVVLLLALPALLSAQMAERLGKLLETGAVNYGEAAQMILEAADLNSEMPGQNSVWAFDYAMGQGWLPADATWNKKVSLDGVSLLIMGSFGIKGGLMYTLFKNPHFAYRELEHKKIIQGRIDPQMPVSGNDLLYIMSRVLIAFGDDDTLNLSSANGIMVLPGDANKEALRGGIQ